MYMNLNFLKLDPDFYSLLTNEKVVAKQDFLVAFDRFQDKMPIATYSLTGLRADCDVLIWRLSPRLEDFAAMSARVRDSGLGKFLRPVRSFLGRVTGAEYASALDMSRMEEKKTSPIGTHKLLFVRPLKKDPSETLDRALKPEHGKAHVLNCAGLDDGAFVLAFDTDSPERFRELLAGLDAGPGETYACLFREIRDVVDIL